MPSQKSVPISAAALIAFFPVSAHVFAQCEEITSAVVPRNFNTTQGTNGLFYEGYGDNRPTNTQNPGTQGADLLSFSGELDIANGSVTNTGPVFRDPTFLFPYVIHDVNRDLLLLHPGTGGPEFNANVAASLTFAAPADRTYYISGSFARANDARANGDGVDVAIIKDFDAANPLFSAHISSDNEVDPDDPFCGTGTANFSLSASLNAGQKLRFLVFAGPQGQDGTFDVTALRAAVECGNAPGPDALFPCGVPTLSEWALVAMALLLLVAGTVAVTRRRLAGIVG